MTLHLPWFSDFYVRETALLCWCIVGEFISTFLHWATVWGLGFEMCPSSQAVWETGRWTNWYAALVKEPGLLFSHLTFYLSPNIRACSIFLGRSFISWRSSPTFKSLPVLSMEPQILTCINKSSQTFPSLHFANLFWAFSSSFHYRPYGE